MGQSKLKAIKIFLIKSQYFRILEKYFSHLINLLSNILPTYSLKDVLNTLNPLFNSLDRYRLNKAPQLELLYFF